MNTLCVQVENFTVSFSDGRVLCYLIHHYHPSLLPHRSVSLLTTQTVECSLRGRVELDCSASESDNSFDSSPAGLNGNCQLGCHTSVFVLFRKVHQLFYEYSVAGICAVLDLFLLSLE